MQGEQSRIKSKYKSSKHNTLTTQEIFSILLNQGITILFLTFLIGFDRYTMVPTKNINI